MNDGDVATELAALAASMTRLAERVGIPEAPPCEPGKHDVPPAAQPGTVTKCRRCRKSVRVPKAKPGEPEPDQRIAELEKRVAERERQMTRLAERARLRMAELEAQLGQAAAWPSCRQCGKPVGFAVCGCGTKTYPASTACQISHAQ